MNTIDIFELIKKLSGVLVSFQEDGPTPSIYVRADHISTVMRHLRETKNLEFDVLMNHTAFHDTENPKLLWHLFFEIATDQAEGHEELRLFWHLYSYTQKHELTIESSIPVGKPEIDSMTSIWKSANWLERESYDLLGIRYIGHPDLRRIMLPEDWEGFPLRKDYVTPLTYQNIDNTPSEITQSFKAKDKQK